MCPAFPSSDYYDGSATPGAHSGRHTCPPPTWQVGRKGGAGTLPTFTEDCPATGSAPSYTPAASPGPHIAVLARASRRPNPTGGGSGQAKSHDLPSTAKRPIHQISQAADD